jgi:LysM repeat protein
VVQKAKPTFTPNKTYKVKLGDSLSAIAAKECGNYNDWPGIYDASKKVIGSNPNLIEVGQRLDIVCKAGVKLPDPPAKTDAAFAATANSSSMISSIERAGYSYSEAYNMAYTALFLYRDGYSAAGAAGVVACIAGESAGNVESVGDGGGGLIGWTPLPYGYVTGNVAHDLATQLQALLRYNDINGPTGTLKSMTNPYYAADFYSQHFERPAVTDSDVRDSVAEAVFSHLP